MLRNKDILELKRRFKKEACTFTKLCGCYVDANKNKVVKLDETFLNLDDEEFYKYLEIAKKNALGHNRQQPFRAAFYKRGRRIWLKTAIFIRSARKRSAQS